MCRKREYNSAEEKEFMKLIAPYYNAIETTEVWFTQEKVIAYADSLGHIEFYDMEKNSYGFVDVPVSQNASEKGHTAQYGGDVNCGVEEGRIVFRMPVYGWDDYYPHCDGESDRWNRYVARWFQIVFDCRSHEIQILDRE